MVLSVSALDAESERQVQDALDRVIKGLLPLRAVISRTSCVLLDVCINLD